MSTAAEPRAGSARWPWVAFALFVVSAIVGMILVVVNDEALGEQLPFVVAFSMFGVVGALILSREPRNVIGGLLLYGAFTTVVSFTGGEILTWLIERGSTAVLAQALGLLSGLGWLVGILPVVFLLPLLFPDGHLPSPRWKAFVWFIALALALLFVSLVFGDPFFTGSTEAARSRIRSTSAPSARSRSPTPCSRPSTSAASRSRWRRCSCASGGRPASHASRSSGSGSVSSRRSLATVGGDLIQQPLLSAVVGGLGFMAFPAAIGVAVLRFHLYDLDVVVRKTVLYAALAVFATLVYLAIVIGVGAWVGRDSRSSRCSPPSSSR